MTSAISGVHFHFNFARARALLLGSSRGLRHWRFFARFRFSLFLPSLFLSFALPCSFCRRRFPSWDCQGNSQRKTDFLVRLRAISWCGRKGRKPFYTQWIRRVNDARISAESATAEPRALYVVGPFLPTFLFFYGEAVAPSNSIGGPLCHDFVTWSLERFLC